MQGNEIEKEKRKRRKTKTRHFVLSLPSSLALFFDTQKSMLTLNQLTRNELLLLLIVIVSNSLLDSFINCVLWICVNCTRRRESMRKDQSKRGRVRKQRGSERVRKQRGSERGRKQRGSGGREENGSVNRVRWKEAQNYWEHSHLHLGTIREGRSARILHLVWYFWCFLFLFLTLFFHPHPKTSFSTRFLILHTSWYFRHLPGA